MNFINQLLTDRQVSWLNLSLLLLTVGFLSWLNGSETPLPTLRSLNNKLFDPPRIQRGV